MSARAGLICALLATATAVAACGGDDRGGEVTSADVAGTIAGGQTGEDANPPMHARVEITSRGYRPKHTRIRVGGSVTFVNLDPEELHTAETGDLPGGADDPDAVTDNNEFDTHTLTWEEPYRIYFHKPERVTYHDSMSDFKGTVEAVPKLDVSR